MVDNAGLSLSRPLLETSVDDWDLQHDVMARGSFPVSREAARMMIAQGMGATSSTWSARAAWSPDRTTSPTGRPGPTRPTSAAELVRCILDSLAAACARTLRDAVRLSGREVEVVHLVGGGARNRLL